MFCLFLFFVDAAIPVDVIVAVVVVVVAVVVVVVVVVVAVVVVVVAATTLKQQWPLTGQPKQDGIRNHL